MSKIRVLIVDDSVVVRRLVTNALNRDDQIEVCGTATDGRKALEKIGELKPDLVLLDFEMPEMDGLQTLAEIRKRDLRLPVIMFSRYTQKGVDATVRALMLGANDYVPKPGDGVAVEEVIQNALIPKIKFFRPATPGVPAAAPRRPTSLSRIVALEVVVIGSSTGGPNALAEVLPALGRDWNTPTLIAQHMPPTFTTQLAERLGEKSGLRVLEAVSGEPINGAQVWVAPGNFHLVVAMKGRGVQIQTNQEAAENSCRPAADVLFRSVAAVYGPATLGVMLTGMGQDGLKGCEAIKAAGGQVIAQDEATSVVWSMPGSVVKAGLADSVLPLDQIGAAIVKRIKRT